MRVYCKRTYFEKNTNFFPINGKEYGQDYVKWALGKIYECHEPFDYEKPLTFLIISSEIENSAFPISEKNFHKHFIDIDELREEKLKTILK